jgi:hypothetical protein
MSQHFGGLGITSEGYYFLTMSGTFVRVLFLSFLLFKHR